MTDSLGKPTKDNEMKEVTVSGAIKWTDDRAYYQPDGHYTIRSQIGQGCMLIQELKVEREPIVVANLTRKIKQRLEQLQKDDEDDDD